MIKFSTITHPRYLRWYTFWLKLQNRGHKLEPHTGDSRLAGDVTLVSVVLVASSFFYRFRVTRVRVPGS